MAQQRALIVDDSRSARVVLTRMLEGFGLSVDAVESAELALTHLQHSRPDVIFMDHLMPGMDGFDAVRVLKANPATTAIPVVMYTSQEGEMYLSQARALGAMGVLPKTLKSGDVAQVLQQLHLGTTIFKPLNTGAQPTTATTPSAAASALSSGANNVVVETPSASASSNAQLAHRIALELTAELPSLQVDPWRAARFWRGVVWAMALLLLATLGGALYVLQQTRQQLAELQTALRQAGFSATTSSASAAGLNAVAAPNVAIGNDANPSDAAVTTNNANKSSEAFAYGEVPLSGARLEHLRKLINELPNGEVMPMQTIKVQTFMADFCLVTNASGAYELAPDELPVTQCEVIGNPFGDNLSVQQRQSVSFANLVASTNRSGKITVQLADGGHAAQVSYPARSDAALAGTWNDVAVLNQRVEFTVSSP